jgi:hypothetical protein
MLVAEKCDLLLRTWRTTDDDLRRRDVLRITLVLKFTEEIVLLQGSAAAQEFKQWIFHVLGTLSDLLDSFKLCEVCDQCLWRYA